MPSLEAAEREAISAIGALGETELTAVKAWVAPGPNAPAIVEIAATRGLCGVVALPSLSL